MVKFLALLIAFSSLTALAETKLGIMGSLLYNTSETDSFAGSNNVDEESELSLGAGVRALMGIKDQLYFRSGASIVQKEWSYTVGNSSADLSMLYLSIPATLYWKASNQVGFFGGLNIQSKLSDDCEGSGALSGRNCKIPNQKGIVLPAVLGFDFAFTDVFSMEISYEYAMMDTAKDIKVSSGVVSFIYNLPN